MILSSHSLLLSLTPSIYSRLRSLSPSLSQPITPARALLLLLPPPQPNISQTVNNGVYKCGFASTQAAYEDNLFPLFKSLDRLEAHLSSHSHPYLISPHLTEADIRLYTTLARFDVAYVNVFQCNLKMIRYDYPHLSRWLRRLYWNEGPETNGGVFKRTTFFQYYKEGYLNAKRGKDGLGREGMVVPKGPVPDIFPLDWEVNVMKGDRTNGTTGDVNGDAAS